MIPMILYQPPAVTGTVTAKPVARTLTIDEAVALTLKQSPDLLTATAKVEEAQGRIAEARAYLRPALTATGTATGLDREQKASFAIPNAGAFSFTTSPRDTSQIVIAADMPVDISGQIRGNINLARVGGQAADYQRESTKNRLIIRVRDAFYIVLQANELVKVAEEAVSNAVEREKTAESYVRAGTTTRFETLRAATATADAKQNLLAAKYRVTLALASLARAIGLPQDTEISLSTPEENLIDAPSFAEAAAEAEKYRPELLAVIRQIRAAEINVHLASIEDAPTMGIGAQYQRSPRPGFGQTNELAALSVKLTIPIYDRGISDARTKQAKAQAEAAHQVYESARNDVLLEVRQALLDRQEAADRLTVAAAALSQAQEQYRLAQNRYRAGVNLRGDLSSPLLEISDAQTALTQAQTNAVNARFEVLRAQSRLEGTLGRFTQIREVK